MNWPMATVIIVALFFGSILACNMVWSKATTDLVNNSVSSALDTLCYQEGWNAGTYELSVIAPDNSTECRSFFTLGLEDGRAGVFEPPK